MGCDEQEMERQQALTQLNPEFEEFLDWWDGREADEEAYSAWVADMEERRLLNRLDLEREDF